MEVVSLERRRKRGLLWRILAWLANTALLVILALFVFLYAASPLQMKGHSMEPAIAEKSTILINKIYYRFTTPGRFDVIAFYADGSSELQIKRVIALPGDCIRISDGDIYINGSLCTAAREYIHDLDSAGLAGKELTVGEGEYFVLGDNAAYSEDSRFSDIGMVQTDQIAGKVWFVFRSLLSFWLV